MNNTPQELRAKLNYFLKFGHRNAIRKTDLARLCQVNERAMRQEIKEMRHAGELIGLSTRIPYGYYFIESAEELEECMATLKGYCVEAALARRDLKVAGRTLLEDKFLVDSGQLKLL